MPIVVVMDAGPVGARWRVRAARDRYRVALYVTDPAGAIHHVDVELTRFFHPSKRALAQRDAHWWGAVAVAAAKQVEAALHATRARSAGLVVPRTVTVREVRADDADLAFGQGTMATVYEFDISPP